jgi:hypothetical protein
VADGPEPEVVNLLSNKAIKPEQIRGGKDLARVIILVALLAIFALTMIGAFVGAMWDNGRDWADVKALLDLLLPAETALLGVAVAFYMTDSGT